MNKVEKIRIKKFKVLEDFEHEFNGENYMIVGENGVGKTSLIQFLGIAFGDQKHIQPDCYGDGVVWIDKDGKNYVLKVKIDEGKSKITITYPDGKTLDSKGALHTLFGAVSFDPDEFAMLSKTKAGQKDQVLQYKKLLPVEFVSFLETEEKRIKDWESERTDLGREVTKLKGSVEKNPMLGSNLNDMPSVDIAKVYEELKVAQKHNETVARGQENMATREKEAQEKEKEIDQLKISLKEKRNNANEIANWLNANPKKDVSEMEKQIAEATEINAKFDAAKALKSDMLKLEGQQNEYGEYTAKIEAGRQLIADAIRYEKLPIDGLGFDEDKLLWNGIPVNPESLSESEVMELGVRIKFAENPEFGILLLNRTESIGKTRWESILSMCKEKGWQVIAEKVERGTEKLTMELIVE